MGNNFEGLCCSKSYCYDLKEIKSKHYPSINNIDNLNNGHNMDNNRDNHNIDNIDNNNINNSNIDNNYIYNNNNNIDNNNVDNSNIDNGNNLDNINIDNIDNYNNTNSYYSDQISRFDINISESNKYVYDIQSQLDSRLLKNVDKLSPEKKSCIICLENFKQFDLVINLNCLHMFHDECIKKWLRDYNYCPICKILI